MRIGSTVPGSDAADARPDDDPSQSDRVPLWVRGEARTPANPYPIRMFAEIGCDFALRGEIDEPPPTRRQGVDECDTLEEELPISDGLREGLLSWALDFFRWGGGDKTVSMDDFDERGVGLNHELQRELGELYAVSYWFEFGGPHREALLASVADEPLPGWTCRQQAEPSSVHARPSSVDDLHDKGGRSWAKSGRPPRQLLGSPSDEDPLAPKSRTPRWPSHPDRPLPKLLGYLLGRPMTWMLSAL